MNSAVVTQRCEFECSYLSNIGVDNAMELNSHRYRVEVSVMSIDREIPIEFSQLKRCIRNVVPDKHFIYNALDGPSKEEAQIISGLQSLHVPVLEAYFVLSAENIVTYIAEQIQLVLNRMCDNTVVVVSVKLRENNDSFVEWSTNTTSSI